MNSANHLAVSGRRSFLCRPVVRMKTNGPVVACCALLGMLSIPLLTFGQQASADAGKNLYATSCAFCHGADADGSAAGPSLRKNTLAAAAVTSIISDGKPGTTMQPFKGTYTQGQIADLTAYVLSLSFAGAGARGVEAPASAESGAGLYASKCAGCHESGELPFLNHFALKAAAPEYIVYMLTAGAMHVQGAALTAGQRAAVAEYITGKRLAAPSHEAFCAAAPPATFSGPQWNGWGVDLENSRFQPADQAGLAAAQVPKLKLRWAFGYPGGFAAYSQPVVAGGGVFTSDPLGGVYSLDSATGCTRWKFNADAAVRTALVIGPDHLAYFGDLRANVYAVDASTGKLIWKTRVSPHPYARVTGTPRLYQGRLYVPVSSREEWMAADPHYQCCTFRGILAALDAATGKEIWRLYAIPNPPRPTRKAANGTQLWGPSGGGLWSSPAVDEARQLLYVGVGDNYSDPPTSLSDSILAVDIKTGKIVWSNQVTPGDTFNAGCIRHDTSTCPAKTGPDFDFGSAPILRDLPGGLRVLVVAQKSGIVFGLDPDKKGAVLWQVTLGHGGMLGGVEWGIAADSQAAYVALSDVGFAGGPQGAVQDPKAGGGLFALNLATGQKIWAAAPVAGCSVSGCSPAQSAAITAISGAVFSGSDDGHLRAYSTQDGSVLWDFDTVRQFNTVNKSFAHGGSIDGGGPAIAGGMVFVNSGFGSLFGIPGNILLAFGSP
ncbi:MAG TPA: PQQ-binding-like beta-propeller repeat protein [Candidatus Acidoferrales bacterium]|nr:PQQ-binding-like beta-propeller repeat protein [Candidatus Acidoferrales bacterium]